MFYDTMTARLLVNPPSKEANLHQALMRWGSYRVDYLNEPAMGTDAAFAFYVCGELPENAAYSAAAKRNLYTGLSLIQQTLGPDNLVAIYLDVNSLDNMDRPAYVQMKIDMKVGLFKRVFTMNASDLLGGRQRADDIRDLYQTVGGFDLLTYDQGAFKAVLLKGMSALA